MAKTKNLLGSWAFLVGFLLAIILGLFMKDIPANYQQYMTWTLIGAGLVVGFLNVTNRETTPFMLSGVVLVIVSSSGIGIMNMANAPVLVNIFVSLLMMFVPATVIVAVKNVFNLAKN